MTQRKSESRAVSPLDRLWPEMDQPFRDLVRGFFSSEGLDRMFEGANLVKVEEIVEDGVHVIRAELPGIDPEKDVEIDVTEGLLHIAAEREERSAEERGEGYRSEFRYGRFERTLRIPEGTSVDEITASYKDGILEVRVPVAEKVGKPAARIQVKKA
jgi:HSP20 family protein